MYSELTISFFSFAPASYGHQAMIEGYDMRTEVCRIPLENFGTCTWKLRDSHEGTKLGSLAGDIRVERKITVARMGMC